MRSHTFSRGQTESRWSLRVHDSLLKTTDELEKYHLNDLKQDMAVANRAYREHAALQAHVEMQKAQMHSSERDKLRDMVDSAVTTPTLPPWLRCSPRWTGRAWP